MLAQQQGGMDQAQPGHPFDMTFFGTAPGMVSARAYHTATLLNHGRVLTTGGTDGNGVYGLAEFYDPEANILVPSLDCS